MRIIKNLVRIIFVLIALVIIAMIAIPYFFKDEIVETIKTEVNDNMEAKVDFESVDLSLFKSFPDLYIGLNNLKVSGTNEFEDVQLLNTKSLDISVELFSLFSTTEPVLINDVNLVSPNIEVKILPNGVANYNITKEVDPANTNVESNAFEVNLQRYSIQNGHINYRDFSSNIDMTIVDVNHIGKGDFTETIFNLITQTDIKEMSVKMDGMSYLKNAKVSYDATLNVNMDEMKLTLKENNLNINELDLSAEGWLAFNEGDINIEMAVIAPHNEFKDLLSMIPGAYIKGYENVQVDGKFKFNSTINGTYNGIGEKYPSFLIDLEIEKGHVQYPDLPMSVTSINTKMNINSPSSNWDDIKIDISKFAFKMGDNPFNGKMKLTNPISNPMLDLSAKGNIDFAVLSRAFPMDDIGRFEGNLTTDIDIVARMSDMESEDYDNIKAKGIFDLQDFIFSKQGLPTISISSLSSNVSPKAINLNEMKAQLGKTDLDLNGEIENYLAYFSPKKTMTGTLNLQSNKIDLNEWMPDEIDTDTSNSIDISSEKIFDRFDFSFDGYINTMYYEDYVIENIKANGRLGSNNFVIDHGTMDIGKSDIQFKGDIHQMFDYLFYNGTLLGNVAIRSDLLDINELMGINPNDQEESTSADTSIIPVPEKIDMTLDVELSKVLYTNMDMRNMKGTVIIKNQKASLINMSSNTLGGEILMEGSYDSKNVANPVFDLDYKMKKVDFKQAFNTFNTFEKIAPIGKFLSGSFTTDMKMDGSIGKDMLPDLKSINADGFLQTYNSVMNNFLPMTTVAQKLNVKELENMQIKDVKTWFEFENGRIAVKEFPYKWKNIDMKIKGGHSLDASMDYDIKMRIPRELIKNRTVNDLANSGLSFLSSQASKLGVDIKTAKFINLVVKMTGSITDPKVGIQLLGTDGKSVNVVDKAKEGVKEIVDKAKDSVKTVVVEKIDDTKEKLKAKADKEIGELMKKANSTAEKTKKEGYRLAEEARKLGYKQADELVKKAGNNVFKKVAAKEAAKAMKKETDKKVEKMKRETDKKADLIIKKAEKEAENIRNWYK